MAAALTSPARKTVQDKIYDSLTKRLELFGIEKILNPEQQVELDSLVAVFADDVANAFRVVAFFGKLK